MAADTSDAAANMLEDAKESASEMADASKDKATEMKDAAAEKLKLACIEAKKKTGGDPKDCE
jgi:uncharacterized protein (DUF2345 family)